MEPSFQEQILNEVKQLREILATNQSDYCDTEEASRILALPPRHLKMLHEKFGLPRYKRVKSFVYKKKECYQYAALLDAETIIL